MVETKLSRMHVRLTTSDSVRESTDGVRMHTDTTVTARLPETSGVFDLGVREVKVKPVHFPPGVEVTIGEHTRTLRFPRSGREPRNGKLTASFPDRTSFSIMQVDANGNVPRPKTEMLKGVRT